MKMINVIVTDIPFPKGISSLSGRAPYTIPFAWSVNGFISVISVISAAVCAIILGYKVVFITSVICYMAAGIVSLKIDKD